MKTGYIRTNSKEPHARTCKTGPVLTGERPRPVSAEQGRVSGLCPEHRAAHEARGVPGCPNQAHTVPLLKGADTL